MLNIGNLILTVSHICTQLRTQRSWVPKRIGRTLVPTSKSSVLVIIRVIFELAFCWKIPVLFTPRLFAATPTPVEGAVRRFLVFASLFSACGLTSLELQFGFSITFSLLQISLQRSSLAFVCPGLHKAAELETCAVRHAAVLPKFINFEDGYGSRKVPDVEF